MIVIRRFVPDDIFGDIVEDELADIDLFYLLDGDNVDLYYRFCPQDIRAEWALTEEGWAIIRYNIFFMGFSPP